RAQLITIFSRVLERAGENQRGAGFGLGAFLDDSLDDSRRRTHTRSAPSMKSALRGQGAKPLCDEWFQRVGFEVPDKDEGEAVGVGESVLGKNRGTHRRQ